MESELDLLLGRIIDSLLKLEVLLHLRGEGDGALSAKEIGGRLSRPVEEVTRALEELSRAGLVERFALGTGRHVLYGSREDAHTRDLLTLLAARYDRDPASRARLVRAVMGVGAEPESSCQTP